MYIVFIDVIEAFNHSIFFFYKSHISFVHTFVTTLHILCRKKCHMKY
uniref:Uncharacterized protein n=1 Tax=Anguilla anguilla TaxID=7936 RepID=A0A0E9PQK5_ANGAN